DDLLDKIAERHHFAAAKVDQLALDAMPLCQPTVLRNQCRKIMPPTLIAALQCHKDSNDGLERGGDGDCIVEPRRDVADAHLKGGEFCGRAEVPPDLRGVL